MRPGDLIELRRFRFGLPPVVAAWSGLWCVWWLWCAWWLCRRGGGGAGEFRAGEGAVEAEREAARLLATMALVSESRGRLDRLVEAETVEAEVEWRRTWGGSFRDVRY